MNSRQDSAAVCGICPRQCYTGQRSAYCGGSTPLRIAAASIHYGEEPPITGQNGSGTIFVSGCNLRCAFCQNVQISQQGMGRSVDADEFAAICIALQKRGAENVNIVTGSHAVPALVEGLRRARAASLGIPCFWNSSAYEKIETLELLDGVIDGYLPDLKTLDKNIAAAFFNAPDYPQRAQKAIEKMMNMTNDKHKVIIRHLVLPGFIESTKEVLRWFAGNARGGASLSLMTQYTPPPCSGIEEIEEKEEKNSGELKIPARFLNKHEYDTALSWIEEFDIEDGFYQELETGNEWLPGFEKENPF
ncbi:MAG: radical SAM protein, partial [Spirochaetaceae bacterium]|nr:radical SAM protein [Spirochaetaceae bacterium]